MTAKYRGGWGKGKSFIYTASTKGYGNAKFAAKMEVSIVTDWLIVLIESFILAPVLN